MTSSTRRIIAVAKGQLGLFTRGQANAVGMTDAQLRSRVQSGTLFQVGTSTFRLPGAPTTPNAELLALILDIGEPVWASGPTAAALHGFDGFGLRPPFDVTTTRDRNVRRIGHRIHTTGTLELIDRATIGGIPMTSAARTLIDLARTASIEQLTVAFDSGLRDGRFSESLVHRRIVALRASGRYGIPRLLAAIDGVDARRGGHSWLEREYLRLIADAGLPRPTTQAVLARVRRGDQQRHVRVDVHVPETPVVVELLGYRFHRTKDEMRRDAERMNALVAQGMRPFQFTYEQVVEQPADVVATTVAALAPFTRPQRSFLARWVDRRSA